MPVIPTQCQNTKTKKKIKTVFVHPKQRAAGFSSQFPAAPCINPSTVSGCYKSWHEAFTSNNLILSVPGKFSVFFQTS